jgi:hypothetical protein
MPVKPELPVQIPVTERLSPGHIDFTFHLLRLVALLGCNEIDQIDVRTA